MNEAERAEWAVKLADLHKKAREAILAKADELGCREEIEKILNPS